MHDPIADMLTRIKNAGQARKEQETIPFSKIKYAIALLLLKEGYVLSVSKKGKKARKSIEVGLKYDDGGKPRVHDVDRVSKVSKRIYEGYKALTPYKNGIGTVVLSTTKGIVTDKEARHIKVGGEVLFKIW